MDVRGYIFDCLARALPGEPLLVLFARDLSAPPAIRFWADDRSRASVEDGKRQHPEQIVAALDIAEAMEKWREEHDGEWRSAQPTNLAQTLLWIDDDTLIDLLSDAISDSMDYDWSVGDGAKAVVRALREMGTADAWWPIRDGKLPQSTEPYMILAETEDGRQMIWRNDLLEGNLARIAAGKQPDHLSFPAVRWCWLPESGSKTE